MQFPEANMMKKIRRTEPSFRGKVPRVKFPMQSRFQKCVKQKNIHRTISRSMFKNVLTRGMHDYPQVLASQGIYLYLSSSLASLTVITLACSGVSPFSLIITLQFLVHVDCIFCCFLRRRAILAMSPFLFVRCSFI